MLIHGPSLAIGAAIAVVAMVGLFFALNMSTQEGFKAEDIKEVQTQNPDSEKTQVSMTLFSSNASPVLGEPDAPITIVEFGDYQCFYCNKFFHETKDKINENYIKTGKAKMIFKDFTIIGPDSVVAAHAAHCADEQGKFWEYHDTLYGNWNGENNGWASMENQLKFAKQVGLDVDMFSECMKSQRYNQKIKESTNDAQTLGLTGTPGFFVIGPNNKIVKIPGAQPYDVFVNVLESEQIKGN